MPTPMAASWDVAHRREGQAKTEILTETKSRRPFRRRTDFDHRQSHQLTVFVEAARQPCRLPSERVRPLLVRQIARHGLESRAIEREPAMAQQQPP